MARQCCQAALSLAASRTTEEHTLHCLEQHVQVFHLLPFQFEGMVKRLR